MREVKTRSHYQSYIQFERKNFCETKQSIAITTGF
jgi:hypothetical protein